MSTHNGLDVDIAIVLLLEEDTNTRLDCWESECGYKRYDAV